MGQHVDWAATGRGKFGEPDHECRTAPVTVELKLQAGHKQPDDQPGDQLSGTLPVLHSSSPVHGSM